MIPETWKEFVEIREKGYRPDVPVIVSLVGDFQHEYPVLVVPDGSLDDLDFRVLVDLQVHVAHVGKGVGRITALADALVRAGVCDLYLWNVANETATCVMFGHEKFIREVPCV